MRERLWIVGAAALVFSGTLAAPFHLDDFALRNDPVVASSTGWMNLWSVTRPLTWATYWLNYRLGGEAPFGYHLANWLLHLACIYVLCGVLVRLIPHRAAVIAAAVFALHPVQTETVAYVFAGATSWMTLFCLLSLREWTLDRPWRAFLWFLPALLAKEECIAFPLVLPLIHHSKENGKRWIPVAAMLTMAMIAGLRVLYVASMTPGSGAGAQSGVTPLEYFAAQGSALWRYVRLLMLPYGFTVESPIQTGSIAAIPGWIALAACVALSIRYSIWWLAAFILVLPSSSIFPAADLSADRRLYLPMIAIGPGIGLLLQSRRRVISGVLLVCLALISVRQTLLWMNGEALWREAVRLAPGRVRPRIQLARQLAPPEALRVLDGARILAPGDPAIASEKGRVLLENGNPALALAEFGRALALAPSDARAVNNRGVALLRLGQKDAAEADFRRALQLDHCLFDALWNLRSIGIREEAPAGCRYTSRQSQALKEGA
ncbi:MAG TPA: tetratricopeptide repeat protein [Bryobacteraceae bacterium]|nr:tetratricopeptide repeat protein [Bryobacteraceae bacterium]